MLSNKIETCSMGLQMGENPVSVPQRPPLGSFDFERVMRRARAIETTRRLQAQIAVLEENGGLQNVPETLRVELAAAEAELVALLPETKH